MGNWVFRAGTEYASVFNGAAKLHWYNTATTTAYAGSALVEYQGTTVAHWIGNLLANSGNLYLMPGTQLQSGAYSPGTRFALTNVDAVAYTYTGAPGAASSVPVVFGSSVYSAQGAAVCRVDSTALITLTTLPATAVLAASSSKLFAFYNESTALKYTSSSNGVSWSAPTSTGLVSSNANVDADIYGSTYGLVYNGNGSFLFTSNGGTAWAAATGQPTINVSNPFRRVWANALGAFVAVGTRLYKTTNGTSWTDLGEVLDGEVVNDIAFGNSMYMVVGAAGSAKTTTDFSTFTAFTGVDFAYHDIYAVTYTTEAVAGASGTPISGTLRLDTSSGAFAARTVCLYDYPTKALVATTTSNGSTGAWEFASVAAGTYFLVAVAESEDITAHRDFDALGMITVS